MTGSIPNQSRKGQSPTANNPLACPAVVVNRVEQPYEVIPAAGHRLSPVVVNSPHSGRHYPNHFLDQASLPLDQLRRLYGGGSPADIPTFARTNFEWRISPEVLLMLTARR